MTESYELPDERQVSDPNEQAGKVYRNLDELLEQIKLDEAEDAPLITPVNYAKRHARLTPQLVYYRIRTGKLDTYLCPCGRRCIKIEDADKVFFPKPEAEDDAET